MARARRGAKPEQGPLERTAPAGPEGCAQCGSRDLTRVPMVLTDGTDVVFVACGTCERREWFETVNEGVWLPIPIEAVLERSTRRT